MRFLVFVCAFLLGLLASIELRPVTPAGVPSLGVSSLDFPAFGFGARAHAGTKVRWPGPFAVEVTKVEDGDTVAVGVPAACPFGCEDGAVHVRIRGIDAPEIHACRSKKGGTSCAACPQELALAQRAKARVGELVAGAGVRLKDISPDKYGGRVVGDLQVFREGGWLSIGTSLLSEGLAVPCDGKTKSKPWCRK